MAKPRKVGGPIQKLSPSAAKKKAVRDKKMAMTPLRRAKKRDSQQRHKDSPVNKNKDYDHKDGMFKSVASNRGNGGKGTRSEGGKNYKVRKKK